MIVDSLTHVTRDGRWFDTHHDASTSRLLTEMDRARVDKAVVVALAGYIENDFVFETCLKYRGRLIPGASLNPCGYETPEAAADEARSVLKGGDFPVLKLHPRLNGYDPLDERCLAVLEAVNSLPVKVRVWLDSNFRSGKCLLAKPPVETAHSLLYRFPDLPFVLLHGGGPLLLQMAELLQGYPNATLDLSLTITYYRNTSLADDILFLLAKRDRRICVGSDFPEYTPLQYLEELHALARKAAVGEDRLRSIRGGNLAALLGEESSE